MPRTMKSPPPPPPLIPSAGGGNSSSVPHAPRASAPAGDQASADLRRRLQEDMAAAGGPVDGLPEGTVGVTMFDLPGSEDNTITVLLGRDKLQTAPAQALVRIEGRSDGR